MTVAADKDDNLVLTYDGDQHSYFQSLHVEDLLDMLASKDSNGRNLPIPAAPARGTTYFAGRLEDSVD